MDSGHKHLALGCIADDFTGASDIASFLQLNGMKCLLINGIPDCDFILNSDYEVIVIALKTRSIPPESAVALSQKAYYWLKQHHMDKIYFKYCSTFDSTPEGNIGPVLDCLLELENIPYTILCPALPVNGRTVQNGEIFVNGIPLDQSSLKDHPLNPMWSSHVKELMHEQSRYPCFDISTADYWDKDRLDRLLEELEKKYQHFYLCPDYVSPEHGQMLARRFQHLSLLSGGSALAGDIAAYWRERSKGPWQFDQTGLILSGSCSETTFHQIQHFKKQGGFSLKIIPHEIMNGGQSIDSVWQIIKEHCVGNILLYSEVSEDEKKSEELKKEALLLETFMADLGKRAVENGIRCLIIAGGETSGAVATALGSRAYQIGKSVAPGVPILHPLNCTDLNLVLKSGNFGQEDFFTRSLEMMRGEGCI